MHTSQCAHMQLSVDTYLKGRHYRVLDFGSQTAGDGHTHREVLFDYDVDYVGVDVVAGDNVDVVMTKPYRVPMELEQRGCGDHRVGLRAHPLPMGVVPRDQPGRQARRPHLPDRAVAWAHPLGDRLLALLPRLDARSRGIRTDGTARGAHRHPPKHPENGVDYARVDYRRNTGATPSACSANRSTTRSSCASCVRSSSGGRTESAVSSTCADLRHARPVQSRFVTLGRRRAPRRFGCNPRDEGAGTERRIVGEPIGIDGDHVDRDADVGQHDRQRMRRGRREGHDVRATGPLRSRISTGCCGRTTRRLAMVAISASRFSVSRRWAR